MVSTRSLAAALLILVVSASSQTTTGALDLRRNLAGTNQPTGSPQAKTNVFSRRPDQKNLARARDHRSALPTAASADPIFLTAPTYDSGGQLPTSIAAGDFNGDGKLDLVVVNSNNVAVLINAGDGTYQPAVTYSTSANPAYVIVADLNGDGTPDLAVGAGQVVNVLIGNGDGTFRPTVKYNSGGLDTPSLAFGDFNHDGKVDLVAAHTCADSTCANSSVSILLGNGDGTLKSPTSYAIDVGYFVQVADFNGDGTLDLAVASPYSTGISMNVVSILLGNGDGTFQHAVGYDAGGSGTASTISMAVGDFNADGKLDLVVADFGVCGGSKTSCYDATVSVMLGNGDGTFQPVVSYPAGSNATDIISADLNGDGKLDLIVTNMCGLSDCVTDGDAIDPGTISVLLGNGDGTFQQALGFDAAAGSWPFSTVAGDFNQDGKVDLAVANQNLACCENGSVGILLGNNNGTFQTTTSLSTGAIFSESVVIGDFNGDGKPDLAVGSGCDDEEECAHSVLSMFFGNGDGTFTQSTNYRYEGGGFQGSSIAAADFNHDGKLDLVATGTNGNFGSNDLAGVSVFLGNGDGTFPSTPAVYSSSANGANRVGLGDFNGDGNLDLAVANQCADNSCANGALSILLGNGDGTFQSAIVDSAVGQLSSFVIADFNNDGKLDLAMPSFSCVQTCLTSFTILFGNGDGTFQSPVTLGTGGYSPFFAIAADFNGDGKVDLIVANGCGNSNCTSNGNTAILLGNGDGTFQAATTLSVSTSGWLAAADFNGDGKLDLLIMGASSLELMLGNGDGTFEAPASYFAGGGGYPAVGDLNRDGKPDLVVPSLETVSVLTNIATGFRYATSTTLSSSANPAVAGQTVTFTARVAGTVTGSPTGMVTFNDGGTSLGSAQVNNGQAALMSTLSAGSHTIAAAYSGDSTFLAGTSSALVETANATPDFSLSNSALTPASVAPGGSSTATVNVTAVNGFNSSVTLTCSVAPAPAMSPTCSIGPASLMSGTPATLTINTSGQTAFVIPSSGQNLYAIWSSLLGFTVAILWLRGQTITRRKSRKLILGCLMATTLALMAACGGTGSRNSNSGNRTPQGTYTITVTGAASGGLQHTTTATFAVQ